MVKCFNDVGITEFEEMTAIMNSGKYPTLCTDSCVHVAMGFFNEKGIPNVNFIL